MPNFFAKLWDETQFNPVRSVIDPIKEEISVFLA